MCGWRPLSVSPVNPKKKGADVGYVMFNWSSVLVQGMRIGLAEYPVPHSSRTCTCSASFYTHSADQIASDASQEFWPIKMNWID